MSKKEKKLQKEVNTLKAQVGQLKGSKKKKTKATAGVLSAPVATAKIGRVTNPRFSGGENFIVVHKREFIGEVKKTDSTSWKIESSGLINPGNSALFPWLSTMTSNWESFDVESLSFSYVSRAPTSTAGAVQMWIDYDSADTAPTTEVDASANQRFVEAPIWCPNLTFVADLKSLRQGKNHHYISVETDVPASADPTNYFVGTFYLAMVGNAVGTGGALYVDYSIKLMIPQKGIAPASYHQDGLYYAATWGSGDFTTSISFDSSESWVPFIYDSTDSAIEYYGAITGVGPDDDYVSCDPTGQVPLSAPTKECTLFKFKAGYSYAVSASAFSFYSGSLYFPNFSDPGNWSSGGATALYHQNCNMGIATLEETIRYNAANIGNTGAVILIYPLDSDLPTYLGFGIKANVGTCTTPRIFLNISILSINSESLCKGLSSKRGVNNALDWKIEMNRRRKVRKKATDLLKETSGTLNEDGDVKSSSDKSVPAKSSSALLVPSEYQKAFDAYCKKLKRHYPDGFKAGEVPSWGSFVDYLESEK